MAQRRMFSHKIVGSARFLKMPVDSQCLYFHLGLHADDDGVVEAYPVLKSLGSSDDNLKVLVAKGFIKVLNEDLVSFILDWKEHNLIRADRKVDSIYKELLIKVLPDVDPTVPKPRADTGKPTGRPMDNQWTAQVRLGKVRLGKVNSGKPQDKKQHNILGAEVIKAFEVVDPKNKTYYSNTTQRGACDFLISEYGLDKVLDRIRVLPKTNTLPYFPKINTPYELKEKWVKLEDTVKTKQAELLTKQRDVIL